MQIFGELRDEYDEDEEDEIMMLSEDTYQVLGSTPLDDINEALGLHIESEDYDSIAGHVIGLLEHFPDEGEQAEDEQAVYDVIQVDKNRIDKVRIQVKPEPEDSEADSSSNSDSASAVS